MESSPMLTSKQINWLFRLVLFLIGTWLAWSLIQVNIDFDDGYAGLTNALYFLGDTDVYFLNRGPLMAFVLMPAQLLSQALGMHPLDVRIAHSLMALFHLGYLVACWILLTRIQGRDLSTLIAYVAAIATPVFFSYAPFLNLDIFPGVFALWMVFLADQQLHSPTMRRWCMLVVLGAGLALTKQTYALVWIGIVMALAILLLAQAADRNKWRAACGLLAAAMLSGALTWIVYALVLKGPYGHEAFLLRPWLQIEAINENYQVEGGGWQVFYPWIYLRNLWAYGILAVLLVLPGVFFALLRGSSFMRLLALVWLFILLMLHLTPYKEVRYLAFLAPFNAVLMVPVVREILLRRGVYRSFVVSLLLMGVGLALPEALRLREPYYRQAMLDFLAPLPSNGTLPARLIMGGPLSFVSPEGQAYFGDRYHRISHISPGSIVSLFGFPEDRYWQIKSTLEVTANRVMLGDIWLLTNGLVIRTKPFLPNNYGGLDKGFFQLLAIAEIITLAREPGGYRITGEHAQAPHIVVASLPNTAPFIARGSIDESNAARLFGWSNFPETAQVIAFRVLRRCGLSECARFDDEPVVSDSKPNP